MSSWLVKKFLNLKADLSLENAHKKGSHALDLHALELDGIPAQLMQLPFFNFNEGLYILNLENNKLSSLPDNFGTLFPNLRYLFLGKNRLTELPWSLQNIESLKKLNVSQNDFSRTGFPVVLCYLKNLKVLWANEIKVDEIPGEIGLLKRLKVLGLKNNLITRVPEEFLELRSLIHISLSGNLIQSFPSELLMVANLIRCSLDENFINDFPNDNVLLKGAKKLKYLSLQNNLLEVTSKMTKAIRKIPRLEYCNLKDNPRNSSTRYQGIMRKPFLTSSSSSSLGFIAVSRDFDTLQEEEQSFMELSSDVEAPTTAKVEVENANVELDQQQNFSASFYKLSRSLIPNENNTYNEMNKPSIDLNNNNILVNSAQRELEDDECINHSSSGLVKYNRTEVDSITNTVEGNNEFKSEGFASLNKLQYVEPHKWKAFPGIDVQWKSLSELPKTNTTPLNALKMNKTDTSCAVDVDSRNSTTSNLQIDNDTIIRANRSLGSTRKSEAMTLSTPMIEQRVVEISDNEGGLLLKGVSRSSDRLYEIKRDDNGSSKTLNSESKIATVSEALMSVVAPSTNLRTENEIGNYKEGLDPQSTISTDKRTQSKIELNNTKTIDNLSVIQRYFSQNVIHPTKTVVHEKSEINYSQIIDPKLKCLTGYALLNGKVTKEWKKDYVRDWVHATKAFTEATEEDIGKLGQSSKHFHQKPDKSKPKENSSKTNFLEHTTNATLAASTENLFHHRNILRWNYSTVSTDSVVESTQLISAPPAASPSLEDNSLDVHPLEEIESVQDEFSIRSNDIDEVDWDSISEISMSSEIDDLDLALHSVDMKMILKICL